MSQVTARAPRSWVLPHVKGHVLLFGPIPPAAYHPTAGLKLLAIFLLLEGLIGPRLWLFRAVGLPLPPVWIRVPVMLIVALTLVRLAAGVRWADVGLKPWRAWSTTEKSYFVQVFVLANVVFSLVSAKRLARVFADSALRTAALGMVVTYLLWGFYQELMYRGILQTELTRRWGVTAGILVSNLLYTFGPLHLYHFSARPQAAFLMFAAIFAIGLFFGLLFWRSGNLWMVGVLHGLGDVYITGLGELLT